MNTISKFLLLKIILIISMIFMSPQVDGKSIDDDHYVADEFRAVSINQKNNDTHAKIFCKIGRDIRGDFDAFTLVEKGRGHYASFENIDWEYHGNFTTQNGLMQLNDSVKKITDQKGVLLETVTKTFDYVNGMAIFRKLDEEGNLVFEKDFPFTGAIVDDTSLVHFVRGIYTNGVIKNYSSFHLLTSEPKLYKVNTKYITEEILNLPSGNQEAVKLQLMADLGFLTEIAAEVVTPTYVWLAKEYPHAWLQYQGLESGRNSAKIKTFVVEKENDK